MVPNELDLSPAAMDAVAVVAALVLMLMSARFLRFLHELEDYARRGHGWN